MSDTPIFDQVNNTTKPNPAPQPKVIAATTGAGVGGALSVLVCWIVETVASIDIPSPVEGAVAIILGAGLAFVGGYWKKN